MRKRLIGLLVIVSMLLSSAGFIYARPGNGNASNNKFKKEFKHEYKNEFEHRFNIVDNVESSDASDWPVKEFKGRIRINMHNKKMNIKFDVPPVVKAGRTLIPVRAVTQGLGATVIENNNDENGDIEIINEDVENEVLNEGADNTNDDNEDVEEAENHSTTNNEGENQE